MKKLAIGEVARRSGVPASAIRYYESVGVLPKPERKHGRRCYEDEVLLLLTAVKVAKRAGFTIKEIRTFVRGFASGDAPSARWNALAGKKLRELDATIEKLQAMQGLLRMGMKCRCLDLRECEILRDGESPPT